MYLSKIITYLVWPVFIFISWLIIKASVTLYEKKSQGAETAEAGSEQK